MRGAVVLAVALLTGTSLAANSKDRQVAPSPAQAAALQTHILGDPEAPHTIIVYMSMICEHCSSWYQRVLPRLTHDFLDSGKAKLVFRNIPTEPHEYSGPAAGLAICAAEGRFFDVVDALLKGEQAVREGASLNEWQDAGVAASGRTREEVEACLAAPKTLAILQDDVEAANASGVFDAPSAVVDGITLREPTFENIKAVIESVSPEPATPAT